MYKYLLIYHEEDNDGLFSGAIFYDYLITKINVNKKDIHLLGATYNSLNDFIMCHPIKDIQNEYESIIMTDISFNDASYMKQLYDLYGDKFIWCDHHKPIIDESYKQKFDLCPGVRNTQKSAILCVYEFLYDTLNVKYSLVNNSPYSNIEIFPEYLRILSAWDSWSYEREGYDKDYVRHVNKGTTIYFNLNINKVLPVVHEIISYYRDQHPNKDSIIEQQNIRNKMYDLGKSLNDYDDITMENIIKESGDCSWKVRFEDEDRGRPLYHTACAIFHQGATNSLMFKSLERKGINHGLVFKHQPNGNWVLSMYNISESEWTHCGEFLKERYNGGGHKGAAGCTLTQDQFINILKKKEL